MIDENIRQELKAKYPDRRLSAIALTADDGERFELVLASPTRAEYQRMTDEIMDPQKRGTAIERFVRSAIKYPAAADVEAFAAKYPAVFAQCSETLGNMAGNSIKVETEAF